MKSYPVPPGKPAFGPSGKRLVYDENGEVCRDCNELADFKSVFGGMPAVLAVPAVATATLPGGYAKDEPPDVVQLGRAGWTLLHRMAAKYPAQPSAATQAEMRQFVLLFARFYPCGACGEDFAEYIERHAVAVESQAVFGQWMCDAHNAVNVKLGKEKFDCGLWQKRWKDGWE